MTDFLVDYRWLVLVVAVACWAWFASAVYRSRAAVGAGASPLAGRTGRVVKSVSNRIPAKKPGDVVPLNRTSTAGMAPSIEAGIAEHHLRSAAATTKLSAQPVDEKQRPTEALRKALAKGPAKSDEDTPRAGAAVDSDAAAKDSLFAGLEEAKTEADARPEGPGTRAIKNAARMEEKGFHHQIASDQLPEAREAPLAEPVAKAPAVVTAPAPITPPPAPFEPGVGVPAKPRSQTAELDDILKRIDQVLAESPAAPASAVQPPPKPPTAMVQAAEKIDPNDVLRRIDEALAESQGDRAGQLTVPRPDWERAAQRAAEATQPRPDWSTEQAPAEPAVRPPLEPPRQTPQATKAAEITVPRPDWADEAKKRADEDASGAAPVVAPPAEAAPSSPAKGAVQDEAVPDWARGDIQDEDLDKQAKAKPTEPGGAEGEQGPQQQKLF